VEDSGGVGHLRRQASLVCGLSSPAITRAKLGKHPLNGALEDRGFAEVLAWCEGAG
jgi:ATP-dependent DNA helicase RecQ